MKMSETLLKWLDAIYLLVYWLIMALIVTFLRSDGILGMSTETYTTLMIGMPFSAVCSLYLIPDSSEKLPIITASLLLAAIVFGCAYVLFLIIRLFTSDLTLTDTTGNAFVVYILLCMCVIPAFQVQKTR
ncbi:hypothetical protein [Escherichia coli]|uniref:hypothetical protein n=1 Tax=Escherichia coli TaxID=562 RepID=UPI0031342E5B